MIFVTFLKRRNLFNCWNCIKMSVRSLRRKRENFINKKLVCGMARSVALESGDEMVFITSLVARHIFWNCRNEICPRVLKKKVMSAYVNFLIFFPNGIYKRQIAGINICIFERWVTLVLLIQIWIIYIYFINDLALWYSFLWGIFTFPLYFTTPRPLPRWCFFKKVPRRKGCIYSTKSPAPSFITRSCNYILLHA